MTPGDAAQRDLAIDTVRGFCIVSMVFAHLARHTWANNVTHPVPWVDGATGFVLLSGLLVGIVQRSTIGRQGFREGALKLLRRTRLVYLAHIFLAMIALLIGTFLLAGGTLPEAADEGGWPMAVLHALTLQVNPNDASVLSVYVVVMLAALPVVRLLASGLWQWACALSVLVYIAAVSTPGWSRFPSENGQPGNWSYAAWFGLFVTGLFAGWWWRSPRVQTFVTSRHTSYAGLALLGVGLVVALLLARTDAGLRILDKEAFGPGRLLLSVVAYFVIWRVVRWGLRYELVTRIFRPLTVVGTRSLDSYVLLTLVVLTAPVTLGREHDYAGLAAACATLLACVGWAYLRRLLKHLSAKATTTA